MHDAPPISERIRALFFRYDVSLPLDPETSTVSDDDGVRVTHFRISSTRGNRIAGLIWAPAAQQSPAPAILLQHGLTSTKEDDYIRRPALLWARAGFVCVAIDAAGHGERTSPQLDQRALLTRPWTRRDHAVQMCNDLQRTVDFLQTRPEIDAARLGYLGFSMGAINGVAFVALDNRVKAAVFALGGARLDRFPLPGEPSISTKSAAPEAAPNAVDSARQQKDVELVSAIIDPVHFAPRIAPRPVLLVNGSRDRTVSPASGQALFEALGDPKRIVWFDGDHRDMKGSELKVIWSFLSMSL